MATLDPATRLAIAAERIAAAAEAIAQNVPPFSLGMVPFAPTSLWNARVPFGKTYTPLAWPTPIPNQGNYWVNWAAYSAPIFVAKKADPLVAVTLTQAGWGYPAGVVSVNIPTGAIAAPGSDGEIVVISGTKVYSFWIFNRTSDGAATAINYGVADVVYDSGWGTQSPFKGAGIMAAGSSTLAGMIVQAETDAGEIQHALQIMLANALQLPGFVAPAINGDGASNVGIAKQGQLLAIPYGTVMPASLSPLGQKVFRAAMNYGCYDIDTAGSTGFRAQQNAYDQPTIAALDADVNVLIPMLHKVN